MTDILPQQRAILEHLKKGHTMTPIDGWNVAKTMKLSTRIGELIRKGYPIIKEWYRTPNGKKVMSYRLVLLAI